MKYIVKQKQEKYIETTVEAKSEEEAKRKVEEGEFDLKDVLEGEYLLPPSDWEVVEVRKKK